MYVGRGAHAQGKGKKKSQRDCLPSRGSAALSRHVFLFPSVVNLLIGRRWRIVCRWARLRRFPGFQFCVYVSRWTYTSGFEQQCKTGNRKKLNNSRVNELGGRECPLCPFSCFFSVICRLIHHHRSNRTCSFLRAVRPSGPVSFVYTRSTSSIMEAGPHTYTRVRSAAACMCMG